MKKYDLSIIIPARNEMFISNTVNDLVKNKRGKTEIIVVLDGAWANPSIQDHPDVTILYLPEAIGQRAATNAGVKLSKAKYVAKVDAHCCFDEGFDLKLMADMQDDWTVTPAMYNFHVFNWVCKKCGNKWYQGSTPTQCMKDNTNGHPPEDINDSCDSKEFERELIWKRRESRRNEFYRFDKNLHFQYWGSFKNRPEGQPELAPTMSIPGNFFMLTREKYWELNICDEGMAGKAGWGQQGVEVACKTWLSGGKLVVNKKTWYAHMFRTQGGDFGFPFPFSGNEQEETREKSKKFWLEPNLKERFPQAVHEFQWLLDKFKPIPDWHDNSEVNLVNAAEIENPEPNELKKGIIFYTDNQLNLKIAHAVQNQLKQISFDKGIPIVSASLKNMDHFGKNIHLSLQRGIETYFKQIIAALEASEADIIYFCEHDVIYHPSHFDFTPPSKDKFYYNQNFWRIRNDGFAVHWDANQVSGLVAYKQLALNYYKERLDAIRRDGFNRSYEPGGRDPNKYEVFRSAYPNIDIRHEGTMTKSKWSPADFRDKSTCVNWQESFYDAIPGWSPPRISKLLFR